jgi:hypothetical protein
VNTQDVGTFKWKKLGKVFDPTKIEGLDWMKEFAQAPSVLLFDQFVRVYFSCRPLPDKNGQYVSYTGFVDLDRKNLFNIIDVASQPILKLGGLGTFDEFGTYPTSVIRNGNEEWAYYAGWTRCESVPFNVAIGLGISHDHGETFEKLGKGPLLSYSLDVPFIVGGPKVRKFNNRWYLWYIVGRKWIKFNGKSEIVNKIRMAESSNGLDWIKNAKDIIENKFGMDECQASPDVFYYNNKYHMFFCYRQATDFRINKNRSYRIGYAYSDDLTNWTRDDSKGGIDVSSEGWDSEMIAYPHVFELDGSIYMFYLGNQVGKYGFGLAQLEGISQ